MDSGHEPSTPQAGTVYSWCSLPSDGRSASDYPLSAACATCGRFIVRPLITSGWQHRADDAEPVAEPAQTEW